MSKCSLICCLYRQFFSFPFPPVYLIVWTVFLWKKHICEPQNQTNYKIYSFWNANSTHLLSKLLFISNATEIRRFLFFPIRLFFADVIKTKKKSNTFGTKFQMNSFRSASVSLYYYSAFPCLAWHDPVVNDRKYLCCLVL